MTRLIKPYIILNPERQIAINLKQYAAFTIADYKKTFQLCGILPSGSHVVIDEFTTNEAAVQRLEEIAYNL